MQKDHLNGGECGGVQVRDDGGPAFPVPGLQHDEELNGMKLRDYFAAKAMAQLIAIYEETGQQNTIPDVAEAAYSYADAMLEARKP